MSKMSQKELDGFIYTNKDSFGTKSDALGLLVGIALSKHRNPSVMKNLLFQNSQGLHAFIGETKEAYYQEYIEVAKKKEREWQNAYSYSKDILEHPLYNVKTSLNKMDEKSYAEFLRIIMECTAEEILEVALEGGGFDPDRGRRTPAWFNRLLVKLARLEAGQSVLDPTMGVGGTLLAAYEAVKARYGQEGSLKLIGQDVDKQALGMSFVSFILHGVKLEDIELFVGDMFSDPKYLEGADKFDRVIQVPPTGMWGKIDKIKASDNRFPFGPISKTATDWMAISSSVAALKPEGGRSVVAVNSGALYKGGASGKIRQTMVNYDFVETVIALPAGVLGSTTPFAIVVCNNHKGSATQGRVQFINVGEDYLEGSRLMPELSEEGIDKILMACDLREDVEGFSKVVDIQDIKDGILLPTEYILSSDYEVDGMTVKVDMNAFSDHDTIPLERIVSIGRGFNMTSRNEDANGPYEVVRITDIMDDGTIDTSHLIRTNPEGGKVENYDLREGDLLLSIRGSMNKVGRVCKDMEHVLFNANLVRLRVKDDRYLPEWLELYLSSVLGKWLLSRMSRGTTVQQITIQDLKALPVPRLSRDEQVNAFHGYKASEERLRQMREEMAQKEAQMKRELVESFGFGEAFKVK